MDIQTSLYTDQSTYIKAFCIYTFQRLLSTTSKSFVRCPARALKATPDRVQTAPEARGKQQRTGHVG